MFAKQRSKQERNIGGVKRERSVSPIPSLTRFEAPGEENKGKGKKLKLELG